jgi:hypothetical protein
LVGGKLCLLLLLPLLLPSAGRLLLMVKPSLPSLFRGSGQSESLSLVTHWWPLVKEEEESLEAFATVPGGGISPRTKLKTLPVLVVLEGSIVLALLLPSEIMFTSDMADRGVPR